MHVCSVWLMQFWRSDHMHRVAEGVVFRHVPREEGLVPIPLLVANRQIMDGDFIMWNYASKSWSVEDKGKSNSRGAGEGSNLSNFVPTF